MRERLLRATSGLARLVLVVVAFGLAVGSIAVSSVRGFCPEPDARPLAMAVLAAAPDDPGTEPAGDVPAEDVPAEDVPADDAPVDDVPAEDVPADDAPVDDVPAEGSEPDGECPGGVQRCLPPMFSSVLLLGEPACHEQAGPRLRDTLVPAFVGSTVLLAGAWWLRPTRLHARRDEETPAEQETPVE